MLPLALITGAVAVGETPTAKEEDTPLPQALVPDTIIFPDVALAEKFTVIELVFIPDAMLAPRGG